MTTIGLIRHGITDWNSLGKAQGVSDIPLNKIGENQASAIGDRLSKEEKWDLIITSDLSRAIETGKIIGNKIGLAISHFDEKIREINCGKIEGTTEEERIQIWGDNWREMNLGMEEFKEVSKRGIDFIEEINRLYKGKRVLVVSHGALIGLTLKRLLPERFPTTYIDHTSLTILNYAEDKWDCNLYNCTKHLN